MRPAVDVSTLQMKCTPQKMFLQRNGLCQNLNEWKTSQPGKRFRTEASLEGGQVMNLNETVAWWRNQAPTYFTDKVFSFSRPDLIGRLGIQKDTRILEIGHGYGRETSQFCKLSDHVTGLELSPVTSEIAKIELQKQGVSNLPNFCTYDGDSFPFPEDSFDVIYSCFVTQHMSKFQAHKFLEESIRVLSKGGHALHEFFGDPGFYHPSTDVFSGTENGSKMYNNAYTESDIIALTGGIEVSGAVIELWPLGPFSNYWLLLTK